MNLPEEFAEIKNPVIYTAGSKITINNKPGLSDYFIITGGLVFACLFSGWNLNTK